MLFLLVILVITAIITIVVYFGRESLLEDSIKLYDEGKQEEALDGFKKYVLLRPKNLKGRQYLSKLYYDLKENEKGLRESIAITVNAFATSKEKADAYALMAKSYVGQEMLDKAIRVSIAGFRLDPKNPNIHYQMGEIYTKTDKIKHAINSFNNVIAANRKDTEARHKLAMLHVKTKASGNAVFQYKKILEIDPADKKAKFELGKLYYELGELERAVGVLEEIDDVEGIEEEYYTILSNHYLKEGNKEKSKEYLENLLKVNPEGEDLTPSLIYELATIYEEEEKLEEAYKLYEKIKEKIPRYKDIEARIQRIHKILYPEEYNKLINDINYNSFSTAEFEEAFYKFIDQIGFKDVKLIEKERNKISIIAVEKFKQSLQTKYLIQFTKDFEDVNKEKIMEFKKNVMQERTVEGIMITTSTYTEEAIEYAEKLDNVQIVDKITLYEVLNSENVI